MVFDPTEPVVNNIFNIKKGFSTLEHDDRHHKP